MVAAHLLCSLHVPQATRRQQLACGSASWRQRAPAQRGVVSCLAYAAKSSPGVDKINKADLETLAKDILNKENEIKNAFQPGRPMPKGSQVAAMRAKVKELRETLAARVQAASTSSDSISTNKEISSLITAVAAAQARESMNTMNAQMKSTQQSTNLLMDDGSLLGEEEVLELEMLQLENEQLRAKASALLMRQHFLEELMQDNDLAVAVPQPPAEYQTPDGRNERNGYYMSSPSYY